MKKNGKKFLAFVLAFQMVLSCFSFAFAETYMYDMYKDGPGATGRPTNTFVDQGIVWVSQVDAASARVWSTEDTDATIVLSNGDSSIKTNVNLSAGIGTNANLNMLRDYKGEVIQGITSVNIQNSDGSLTQVGSMYVDTHHPDISYSITNSKGEMQTIGNTNYSLINGEAQESQNRQVYEAVPGEQLQITVTLTDDGSGLFLTPDTGFYLGALWDDTVNQHTMADNGCTIVATTLEDGTMSYSITYTVEVGADGWSGAFSSSIQDMCGNNVEIILPIVTPGKNGNQQPKSDSYAYVSESYINYKDMDMAATGEIVATKKDEYGNPYYDVEQGIPTSEALDYTVHAKEYLYDITERVQTGVVGIKNASAYGYTTYEDWTTTTEEFKTGETLPEDSTYEWYEPTPVRTSGEYSYYIKHYVDTFKCKGKTFTYPEAIEASSSYHDVTKSDIYFLKTGELYAQGKQDTLQSGTISFTSNVDVSNASTHGVEVTANTKKISQSYCIQAFGLGEKEKAQAAADAITRDDVKNCIESDLTGGISCKSPDFTYSFNGLKITKNSSNNKEPEKAQSVSGKSEAKKIPSHYHNGFYDGGGSVNYTSNSGKNRTFYFGGKYYNSPDGNGPERITMGEINDVLIHTPVVSSASVTSSSNNQKINQEANKNYWVLDNTYKITLDNKGVHKNAKGYSPNGTSKNFNYGNGIDKISWAKEIEVIIPFDCYVKQGR